MKAAEYIQTEEMKREIEREKRDREFWTVMFGGQPSMDNDVAEDVVLEDSMSKSALRMM